MELHPYLQQVKFVKWHHKKGINVTAYSPFGNLNPTYTKPGSKGRHVPTLLENPTISMIAKRRGYSNLQVALAWGIGRGTSVIPKSDKKQHIQENFESLNLTLTKQDFQILNQLGKEYVKRFNNPSDAWGVRLFRGLDDSRGSNWLSGWAATLQQDL